MRDEKQVYFFQEDGKYSLNMCYDDEIQYYKTDLDEPNQVLYDEFLPWQHRYNTKINTAKIKTLRKFVNVPKRDFRFTDMPSEKMIQEHLSKSFPFAQVVGVRGHDFPDYADIYELELNYAIDEGNPIYAVVNYLEERVKAGESWQRNYEDKNKELNKECEHHLETQLKLEATGKAYEELSWVFDNPSFMVLMKLTKTWLCNIFKSKD